MKQRFRTGHNSNDYRRNIQAPNHLSHKFDEITGQIYTEVTSTIRSSNDQGWDRNSHLVAGLAYRHEKAYARNAQVHGNGVVTVLADRQDDFDDVKSSRLRSIRGSRSLVDTAIECILHNISDITEDGIECLPQHVASEIWQTVKNRCTMSVAVFKTFTKALGQEELLTMEDLRYRQNIPQPTSPLVIYTAPLTSESFDFLTSLTITTEFSIAELYNLSSITNLGILELINTTQNPMIGVGDRLIQTWSKRAQDRGGFSVLRILRIWNYKELTDKSLKFLSGFPSLAVYDVQGCRFNVRTAMAGTPAWSVYSNESALAVLERECQRQDVSRAFEAQICDPLTRRFSSPLWDTASVRWSPRTELIKSRTKRASCIERESICESEPLRAELDKIGGQNVEREHFRRPQRRERNFSIPKAPETWDFEATTVFARIGELRDDCDLSKAGIDIGQRAIVGDELVNSIPMISLCLGKTQALVHKTRDIRLVFLRIQSDRTGRETPDLSISTTKANRSSVSTALSRSYQSTKLRQNVVINKKRKLEDVLGSYM